MKGESTTAPSIDFAGRQQPQQRMGRRTWSADEPREEISVSVGRENQEYRPDSPYRLVRINPQGKFEFSIGDELLTLSPTRGALLRALAVGLPRAQTLSEIAATAKEHDPQTSLHEKNVKRTIEVTRRDIADKGPKIVSVSRRNPPETRYYIEDLERQARAHDFSDWDPRNRNTHMRFDPQLGEFTMMVHGDRRTTRIGERDLQIALEHLVTHANEEISTHELRKVYEELQYNLKTASIGDIIDRLRSHIYVAFLIEPRSIISTERTRISSKREDGVQGIYTLLADRAEVVEDDGSIAIIANRQPTRSGDLLPGEEIQP